MYLTKDSSTEYESTIAVSCPNMNGVIRGEIKHYLNYNTDLLIVAKQEN
jgi:hypothetical protein